MRNALLFALALLTGPLSGCGSIDNAPLRVGTVRGRLTQSDPTLAVVAVVGAPEISTAVGPDGHWELAGVPAGESELFVLASSDSATRIPVHVDGARAVELGDVAPRPGGFLQLEVATPGQMALSNASVSVEGTPLRKLKLEKTGRARVGPLPEGCYEIAVTAAGFPVSAQQSCVTPGEQKPLKVELADDPSYAQRGCQYSGCVAGAVCAADGRCVECTGDTQCAAGFKCKNDRCEGSGKLCAACSGDWQCGKNTLCRPLPEGGSACLVPCTGAGTCSSAGFACVEGSCVPDGSRRPATCAGYQVLGGACTEDAECQARGLEGGVCASGSCGLSCTDNAQCPDGSSCGKGSTPVCSALP
ncbi:MULTISPECIES: carboxypeptidase regulatory-like domain-containing protein [Myxococcaceae]|uniref:carboxypeptidase regulatory-like domain-containing protein n=1 Tax=Myxococcaceae TaxID=31 RepID=UPI00129C266E|nr:MULTISPECIES: carboxypeptidase regulatory-like domain-containing protein [Myxococcaceae]MBF5042553.1 carboxypeptidase regulatory-like domain-containing protein [Simulacricoccus sp. 17bor-14]